MGVQFNIDNSGSELTIKVNGRFDFSTHQEFREAYETISPDVDRYIVDLGNTSYLDSSALGMLLLLRDHAGGDSASVKIVKCNDDVRKILTISNFEQLFTIQ
ncbi:MAG: anti-anti-sigma factor [Oleispira sp.]|jgi:anti-anti-sigma factor